jgi:hypothetical protein
MLRKICGFKLQCICILIFIWHNFSIEPTNRHNNFKQHLKFSTVKRSLQKKKDNSSIFFHSSMANDKQIDHCDWWTVSAERKRATENWHRKQYSLFIFLFLSPSRLDNFFLLISRWFRFLYCSLQLSTAILCNYFTIECDIKCALREFFLICGKNMMRETIRKGIK